MQIIDKNDFHGISIGIVRISFVSNISLKIKLGRKYEIKGTSDYLTRAQHLYRLNIQLSTLDSNNKVIFRLKCQIL